MAYVTPVPPNVGDLITNAQWVQDVVDNMIAMTPAGIEFFIDGGGSVLTVGIRGTLEVPFKCDINAVRLLADQSGSVVVDVWKETFAAYPPTNADSITASAVPTIVTADKSEDTVLTGWTTALAAGDILYFNVDSASAITWVLVSLRVTRS